MNASSSPLDASAPSAEAVQGSSPKTRRKPQSNQAGTSRREQIIGCAIDALCELGFAGASVGEIARRAGVSKGVITYHFPGKEALFIAVVTDLYTTAGARIAERIDAAANASKAIRGYLEANLDFIAEQPRRVRAAMEVMGNIHPSLDETPPADPVTDHLGDLLRSGQESGEFGDFDARSVAIILRAAIDAAARSVVADPRFDFAAYRNQLIIVAERATAR